MHHRSVTVMCNITVIDRSLGHSLVTLGAIKVTMPRRPWVLLILSNNVLHAVQYIPPPLPLHPLPYQHCGHTCIGVYCDEP